MSSPHVVSVTVKDSPVFVYQCVEGHAIPPAGGEIVNVDIGVPKKYNARQLPDKGLCFAKCSVQRKACWYSENVRQ